nr:MAG TPA: hypothetical protein [Caudoviricetes sp.]
MHGDVKGVSQKIGAVYAAPFLVRWVFLLTN